MGSWPMEKKLGYCKVRFWRCEGVRDVSRRQGGHMTEGGSRVERKTKLTIEEARVVISFGSI